MPQFEKQCLLSSFDKTIWVVLSLECAFVWGTHDMTSSSSSSSSSYHILLSSSSFGGILRKWERSVCVSVVSRGVDWLRDYQYLLSQAMWAVTAHWPVWPARTQWESPGESPGMGEVRLTVCISLPFLWTNNPFYRENEKMNGCKHVIGVYASNTMLAWKYCNN